MQFSRIFGIKETEWTISTVNLQKKRPEFSKLSFKIGFIGIVKYCYFPVFLT